MADTTITLATVTQDAFNNAEQALINLVRSEYPALDLRAGTVLRDWLVRPAAAVYANNKNEMANLQSLISVNTVLANPNATASDLDGVLANFAVSRSAGGKAGGSVLVKVSTARTYVLAVATPFSTSDGFIYQTGRAYTIKPDANTVAGELPLYTSTDGTYFYFVVPVVAEAAGAAYNVAQGTSFTTSAAIYSLLTAEAYSAFAGGADAETGVEALNRLPAAVSYRAMESRLSIEAKLRDEFTNTSVSIQTISFQGYGDGAQLRDKHNPMGFAVGSRVDIYPRTFQSPNVVILQKTGTRVAANTYTFTIERLDAPGFYAIRSIAEPETTLAPSFALGSMQVIGSYPFSEVRTADGVAGTYHDIDPANATIESAYTIYQKSTVLVTGVPDSSATHAFKLELYTAPGLQDIQMFVDNYNVRNLEADQLVRCPLMCMVRVNITAYYSATAPVDVTTLKQKIFDYINGRSFATRLTRSELAGILLNNGVTRLDLANGFTLQGVVRAADGTMYTLQGDALDLAITNDPKTLFTADTTVFATEADGVFIQTVAE